MQILYPACNQIGAKFGGRIQGEQLRGMLALIVIAVCLKLTFDLVVTPSDPFAFDLSGRH